MFFDGIVFFDWVDQESLESESGSSCVLILNRFYSAFRQARVDLEKDLLLHTNVNRRLDT